jgi:glycosyltransferase involved in cell wall biosynthesis
VRADVVHVLPHAHTLGGTERTVLDLLDSPELNDVSQRVVFVRSGPFTSFPESLVLTSQDGGWQRLPSAVLAVAQARPKVIHSWLLQGNLVGAAARVLWPLSSLVTSERNLGHTLTPAKRRLEHIVASLESVATANSSAVRDAAGQRLPQRERKMRVILPGIEPPLRPARVVPTTAVMVGRLHPVKDHSTALRAWALVRKENPGAVLTIVGDGPERSGLEALGCSLGLQDGVRFVGQTDPWPHLFGAQVYLSTSLAEGFSRSLLEALLAGVPSVASAVGGVAEIPPGALHLVPPGHDHAVAAVLNEVLRDADAQTHAARMADVVASRFSARNCHRAYRELYRELGVS